VAAHTSMLEITPLLDQLTQLVPNRPDGADFAVLLVGVLGALAGAREYGSRMILATIAAALLTLIRLPPADHVALWPLSSGPTTILWVLRLAAESVRSQRRRTGAGTTAPRRWRADGRSLSVR
jgi:hypothetical protein